jgi:hypothetical protein
MLAIKRSLGFAATEVTVCNKGCRSSLQMTQESLFAQISLAAYSQLLGAFPVPQYLFPKLKLPIVIQDETFCHCVAL